MTDKVNDVQKTGQTSDAVSSALHADSYGAPGEWMSLPASAKTSQSDSATLPSLTIEDHGRTGLAQHADGNRVQDVHIDKAPGIGSQSESETPQTPAQGDATRVESTPPYINRPPRGDSEVNRRDRTEERPKEPEHMDKEPSFSAPQTRPDFDPKTGTWSWPTAELPSGKEPGPKHPNGYGPNHLNGFGPKPNGFGPKPPQEFLAGPFIRPDQQRGRLAPTIEPVR